MEFRALTAEEDERARRAVRPDLAPEAWRWALRENPAGSSSWAALEDGRVVAHAALVGARVWAAGKERRFGELAFLFEERPGLLALLVRGLLDAEAGPRGVAVVHGWPEPVHGRLLERMLGFETVRTEVELARDLGAPGKPSATPPEVLELERFGEDARWLFDRCAGAFGASTLRDATYLDWRWVDRPGSAVHRLGVRDAEGVLRGLAVLRPEEGAGGRWGLVDWLVPPEEPEVGEALVRCALFRAAAGGARALTAAHPPWSPWFASLQRLGFRVHPRGTNLLARSAVRRLDDLWLREGWWLQPGDSVLV